MQARCSRSPFAASCLPATLDGTQGAGHANEGVRDATHPALRIRLLGGFGVERAGRELAPREVGSRKARTVLKVLAARRGRMVPMDSLVEALWRDRPPTDAPGNVATLVSRLRAALGVNVIEGTRAGYRLVTGSAVVVDLDEAAALVAEAEARFASGQPALVIVAVDAALAALGAGRILEEEPDADWAGETGREAERLLRRARAAGWRAASAVGDHRRALDLAADAAAADPLDEEAHRVVMRAHHRLGEPGAALAAYERLRTLLVDELGAAPGPDTERLYLAVLRDEPILDDETGKTVPRGAGAASPGALVGRAQELQTVMERWVAAVRGTTSCVLMTGEAGIGKTTLATEIARQAEASGALVLEARCYEAERSLFLQPVLEIVRAALARAHPARLRDTAAEWAGPLGAVVPELRRLLPTVDYRPAAAELERRRMFEAISSLLVALARQQPLMVWLDDLHLAGASTVELVHFLLRWDPTAPLLVLATLRSDESDEAVGQLGPLSTVLDLGPLSDQAVGELAARAGLGDRATEVAALTRGHSLFVVEVLRALAEGDQAPLPASLHAAVGARARRCGPEVEEVLRVAALIGSSVDLDEVADLSGLPVEKVAHGAERACRAGLLIEAGGRYEFANQLVRSTLYETTPAPIRVVRHRRLAGKAGARPEAAAAHAAAAGDWEVAIRNWLHAARRAAAAFANREAEALLTQAFDSAALVDSPVLVAQVQFERGRARLALGRYKDASTDLAAAQQLARAVGAAELEAAAAEHLGWAAYHARDRRALPLAERAVSHPGAGPGARVLWGRVRNLTGDVTGAIAALEPVAAAGGTADPPVSATALSYLATALCHADRFSDAAPVADDAIEACRRTGALRAMLNAQMFGAIARANLGELGTALDLAERLREDSDRLDAPFYRPRALNILAWISRELGRLELARDLATEAFEACSGDEGRDAEREPAANALLALAESAVLAGDPGAAARLLAEIDPLLTRGVSYAWRIELRRLELLARLEPQRADELRDLARQRASMKYESLALALLGRHGEASRVAARTGSDWLLAVVAEPPVARCAVERLAARLPDHLRADFVARGALAGRRR